MKQSILLFAIILLLTGCDNATLESDRFKSLYRQRIEYSKYVIYDYEIYGHFVFDGEKIGLTILDSNVAISENKINHLPALYFVGKPILPNLKMIDVTYGPVTESDTSLNPQRQYSTSFSGINIHTTEYKSTYSTGTSTGLMEYQFDGFQETKDSLIFFNISKIFGGRNFASTTSFAKGNIKIVDSTDNKINYIEINEPVIGRQEGHKLKSSEIVPNQPVVGVASFWFYPKTKTLVSEFTDYGIYKRIK